MLVIDLEKARALKQRKFRITTRNGRTYTKYFKTDSAIAAARLFAMRHGNSFEEIDEKGGSIGAGKPKLYVHGTTTSEEALTNIALQAAHGEGTATSAHETRPVEEVMAERQDAQARIAYSRIGNALARLDPEGYRLARKLEEQDAEISALAKEAAGIGGDDEATPDAAQLREAAAHGRGTEAWDKLSAARRERDRISTSLLSRPLADKLVRVVALESEIKALRKEQKRREKSDEWSERWKQIQANNARLVRNAKRSGKQVITLKMFPDIEEKVRALKRKLKFVRGKAHRIQRFSTPTAALKIVTDHEAMKRLQESPGEITFLLSEGKWPHRDERGLNKLSDAAQKNLWNEWSGIISNIVSGRMQRGRQGTDWKHIVPDFKNIKDDLTSRLKKDLLEAALRFTPDKAERSKGFKAFAIFSLTKNANQELLKYLKYSKGKRRAKDEALGELEDFLSADDPTAAGGTDTLRSAAPLASRYITPEENVMLKEGVRIMNTHIGADEVRSVLEALNIVDKPDNRTAKQKANAAEDLQWRAAVAVESRKRLAEIFPEKLDVGDKELAEMAFSTPAHRKALEQATRLKNLRAGLWVEELSPSHRRATWEALTLLNKIVDQRSISPVETSSWKRLKTKEGTREVSPLHGVRHVVPADDFRFRKESGGTGHMRKQRHINPAAAAFWSAREKEFPGTLQSLGLTAGFITGFEGQSAVPTKIQFEHAHVEPSIRRAWTKLSKMPAPALQHLSDGLKIDATPEKHKATLAKLKKLGVTQNQFSSIVGQLERKKSTAIVKSLTRGAPSKAALKALWRKLVTRAMEVARGK